jgi:hypothetical protein
MEFRSLFAPKPTLILEPRPKEGEPPRQGFGPQRYQTADPDRRTRLNGGFTFRRPEVDGFVVQVMVCFDQANRPAASPDQG